MCFISMELHADPVLYNLARYRDRLTVRKLLSGLLTTHKDYPLVFAPLTDTSKFKNVFNTNTGCCE
jgi:hypothetical protein